MKLTPLPFSVENILWITKRAIQHAEWQKLYYIQCMVLQISNEWNDCSSPVAIQKL